MISRFIVVIVMVTSWGRGSFHQQCPVIGIRRAEILAEICGRETHWFAEIARARIEPASGEWPSICGQIHRRRAAVRKINHIGLSGFGERDSIGTYASEGLHPRERQRSKEVVQRTKLGGGTFVAHGERVMIGSVDAIPDVAVANRAIEAGGEVSARADDPPCAAPHFISVMDLFLLRWNAAQVFVAVLSVQHRFLKTPIGAQARDENG